MVNDVIRNGRPQLGSARRQRRANGIEKTVLRKALKRVTATGAYSLGTDDFDRVAREAVSILYASPTIRARRDCKVLISRPRRENCLRRGCGNLLWPTFGPIEEARELSQAYRNGGTDCRVPASSRCHCR